MKVDGNSFRVYYKTKASSFSIDRIEAIGEAELSTENKFSVIRSSVRFGMENGFRTFKFKKMNISPELGKKINSYFDDLSKTKTPLESSTKDTVGSRSVPALVIDSYGEYLTDLNREREVRTVYSESSKLENYNFDPELPAMPEPPAKAQAETELEPQSVADEVPRAEQEKVYETSCSMINIL